MKNMRKDFAIIEGMVHEGEKVLDLGCGDGFLLHHLKHHKRALVRGVEIDFKNVVACLQKGLSVIHGDIQEGLTYFPPNYFDVVILSRTIQELSHPQDSLRSMLGLGRRGIVAFLNYGYWVNRVQFLWGGTKPQTEAIPHSWYDTPNIHPLSIRDFETFCRETGLSILHRTFLKPDWELETRLFPNLFAGYAIYMVEKNGKI